MPEYRFVTDWEIAAPPEAVFDAILDSLRWPEWWRGVTNVEELEPGDERGIGNVRRYTFRSLLPYALVFDVRSEVIEPLSALRGRASGELEGEGRWSFVPTASGTHVRYEWDVRTTQWWMNLVAPVARPLFAWNHDIIMRWGEQGLRKRYASASASRVGGRGSRDEAAHTDVDRTGERAGADSLWRRRSAGRRHRHARR